ncbi:uncharacterized [Tachysurus ichikawai]
MLINALSCGKTSDPSSDYRYTHGCKEKILQEYAASQRPIGKVTRLRELNLSICSERDLHGEKAARDY